MNHNGSLSNSPSSIARAGAEVQRPSRMKVGLAFLARAVSENRIVDAIVTVSVCARSHCELLESWSLTG